MKCKFAQFLFRAFGITGGALAVLFVIYYYNLDMKLMRSVVVPFLNKHLTASSASTRSDRGGANHGSQS